VTVAPETPDAPPLPPPVPADAEALATPARRRRWLRVLGWMVGGVLLATALLAGLGLWALGQLHHPRIKPHVVQAALDYGGLQLDFAVLRVSPFSGEIHAEGLSFEQPARFAQHAPQWLTVEAVDAELDARALLSGAVHVHALTLAGAQLHVVRDAQEDTFGLLFPSDPDSTAPATPLSASLTLLRGLGVEVDALSIQIARAEVIEVEGSAVISRAALGDVVLEGHLHESGEALDVRAALRSPTDGHTQLTLWQSESAERDAEGQPLRAALDLGSELTLDVSVAVADDVQLAVSLSARPEGEWAGLTSAPLRAEAALGLRFVEGEGRTEVDLRIPSALGGLLSGQITGELRDDTPSTLRAASGRVDAQFDELPLTIPGVSASGFRAALVLADATLGPEGVAGQVDLEATLARADVAGRTPGGHVQEAHVSLETRASAAGFEAYELDVSARSFAYHDGAEGEAQGADGEQLALRLTGPTLDAAWLAAPGAGEGPSAGGAPGPAPDVLTVTLARLGLQADPASALMLQAPDLRAEGPGLLRAVLLGQPLSGDVTLTAQQLAARDGRDRLDAAPLRTSVAMHGLLLEGAGMFGLGGALDVTLDGDASFASGGQTGQVRGLAPRLHVDLDTGSVHGDIAVASLTTRERGEEALSVRDAALSLRAESLLSLAPPRSRGLVHVEGRVAHVASGGTSLSLPRVTLDLRGQGGSYALEAGGRVAQLTADGQRYPGTHPLRVVGTADLRAHAYELDARLGVPAGEHTPEAGEEASDPAAPELHLAVRAALADDGRTVNHHVEGSARQLAPLIAPYLPEGTQLTFDDASLTGGGALVDALASPARAGRFLELRTDLARVLSSEQQLALTLRNLRYATEAGLEATAATAQLDVSAVQRDGRTQVTLTSRTPAAHIVDGRQTADIDDLSATVVATLPDLAAPTSGQFTLDVRARHVGQTFLRGYPVGNLHVAAAVDATPISLTLSSLTIENPRGHTRLELSGAYEGQLSAVRAGREVHAAAAIYGREALGLSGTFEQDLMAFSGTSFARRARGTLRVPVRIESGDLSTYRVSARVEAHDVYWVDMASGIAIEGLEGEIPIVEVVTLTDDGYVIQASGSANPLGRARFPDVQPFLERDAFLSATRILIADQVLGPLAGNLRVEGTTVALDRLQVGFRGGVLTGQLEADLRPAAAYVTMRGNATGVQGREPEDLLDANFALRFAPETLALDGSLQLVRMSKSHLEALLDVLDPYREDTNMNTIRALLPFGYPRFLRARVEDGLMDLELRLGGIAGVASIQDIRAIPIAPLLDDYVAPIVDPLFRVPARNPRDEDEDESDGEGEDAGENDAAEGEAAAEPSEESTEDE
jgi:translocation and assembly module TamB